MTYSIVGSDTRRGELGGAGTSCLDGEDVYVIYGATPGIGVVHAQAYYNLNGRRRALELLEQGQSPGAAIADITLPTFDPSASIRQYGIIDARGQSAAFTGSGTDAYAGDRRGAVDAFSYSVQGNLLTSSAVLSQAAQAFEAGGCDLAERLMSALEAGAHQGEGDGRCTPRGIPSDSAFLQVEAAGSPVGGYLALRVQSSGDVSPLPLLRQQLDAWRVDHPCPVGQASAAVEDGGCGCRVPHGQADHGSALLFGGLAIVAWLRHRSPRQLRPIQSS
jgi:uncharacterized Ntn-hydrolase superfamily protein